MDNEIKQGFVGRKCSMYEEMRNTQTFSGRSTYRKKTLADLGVDKLKLIKIYRVRVFLMESAGSTSSVMAGPSEDDNETSVSIKTREKK
jgi:hypothetical protein